MLYKNNTNYGMFRNNLKSHLVWKAKHHSVQQYSLNTNNLKQMLCIELWIPRVINFIKKVVILNVAKDIEQIIFSFLFERSFSILCTISRNSDLKFSFSCINKRELWYDVRFTLVKFNCKFWGVFFVFDPLKTNFMIIKSLFFNQ